MNTQHPEYRQRSLVMTEHHVARDFKWTPDTLGAFTARVKGNDATDVRRLVKGKLPGRLDKGRAILAFNVVVQKPSSWYNNGTHLDTMNHEAVREFIVRTIG